MKSLIVAVLFCVAAITGVAASQQAAQTPTQFYLAYRAAFDKAKSVDEIKSYHSKAVRAQMDATPAAERGEMFQMMKMMGAMTNVKVVKETAAGNSATLEVEALDADKAKAKGVIKLVKEDNAWKIDKEDWSS